MKLWRTGGLRRDSPKRFLYLLTSVLLGGFGFLHFFIVSDLNDWRPSSDRLAGTYIQKDIESVLRYPRVLSRGEEIDVLGIIHSSPGHFEHRDAIRRTWMQDWESQAPPGSFKAVFLLGNSPELEDNQMQSHLHSEMDTFGDIILEDFQDTYNNLTLKSILMLKFVVYYDLKIKFLFKMDDDIYINVDRYPEIIDLGSNSIGGNKFTNSSPIRYSSIFSYEKKWVCPKWMFEEDKFPPYIEGSGYLIPGDKIGPLFTHSLQVPIVHLEDVFITGILAQRAGIARENIESFVDKSRNVCSSNRTKFIYHSLTPRKILQLHQLIGKGSNDICK
uniref:Hexosyltransferase n=1 Tax=Caligus rogercresseyi TaxID=217165 RepID=C1BNU4_CALRO|nr:Beta-1,3-galactosyltransferase 1 [Caligus rogercresseyi]